VWAISCAVLAGLIRVFPDSATAETNAVNYRADMDFLLQELPRRAGHFFPAKQIDWQTVSNQFRVEAIGVSNDVQHVKLCQRLLARLKDGHAHLVDLKVQLPDESQGRRRTGPRVHLLNVGEQVYVRQSFGSALTAGVQIGDEVLRIDGQPAFDWLNRSAQADADTTGYSTSQQALYAAEHWGLADWEGTPIKFEVRRNGTNAIVEIVRRGGPNYAPIGPIFPPPSLATIGRQAYGKTTNGLGYIHLRDVPGNLPEQLDTVLAAVGDVPGLILDMRANGGGGCDHAAVFGRFIPAGQKWRTYVSAGKNPYAGPMVVIVDAGTRSAGETVAGMLKEDGRAYMIGDSATAGMSSSKTTLHVPGGLFAAYFSLASNMGRFNNGKGIEGIGILPHEIVNYDPKELAQGVDTQIRRTAELLKKGLPTTAVPYLESRQSRSPEN